MEYNWSNPSWKMMEAKSKQEDYQSKLARDMYNFHHGSSNGFNGYSGSNNGHGNFISKDIIELVETLKPSMIEEFSKVNELPQATIEVEESVVLHVKEKISNVEHCDLMRKKNIEKESIEIKEKERVEEKERILKIQAMMKMESLPTIVSSISKYVSSYDSLKYQLVNNDVSGEPSSFGCELVHDDFFFDAKAGGFLEFNCALFVVFHETFKENYVVLDLPSPVGPTHTVGDRLLAELDCVDNTLLRPTVVARAQEGMTYGLLGGILSFEVYFHLLIKGLIGCIPVKGSCDP
ncbi:hypothetical protein M9H77_17708 [Catharanthus roseus]|uniref:Uncharacterized protein n=1 Tax=Catharanthus roseus TaxID=4058 RepID=A0ACC0B5C5_CATRO|nr:hypothetical protein M9H77_17708 [Catharanthus roseus]